MNNVLQYPQIHKSISIHGTTIGVIHEITSEDIPLVEVLLNADSHLVAAKMICDIQPDDVGKEVLLSFINNNIEQPVILGIIRSHINDKESPLFSDSDEDIDLSTGMSSITLKPSGRIEIKGVELALSGTGNIHINGENVLLNCDQDKK